MASTRAELLRRGAEISEVQDLGGIAFAYFSDPDGNRWVIQEATAPEAKEAFRANGFSRLSDCGHSPEGEWPQRFATSAAR